MTTITIDRATVEQALEALTAHADLHGTMYLKMDAIDALRAALAQQAEPVAWVWETSHELAPQDAFSWVQTAIHKMPLYTAPPQRNPLTEEEIDALPWNGSPRQFARAIERAHGIGEGA